MERQRPIAYMPRLHEIRKRVLSEWLVVRTKTGQERYAARNVRRQGRRCVCPFWVEPVSTKEHPMFPGYVFVLGPDWYYLRSTYGVIAPVMMGGVPARMPLRPMRSLLKMLGEDDVLTVDLPPLRPGEPVAIRTGPWAEWTGLYVGPGAKNNVRVLMSVLGGEYELEFARANVAPPGYAAHRDALPGLTS